MFELKDLPSRDTLSEFAKLYGNLELAKYSLLSREILRATGSHRRSSLCCYYLNAAPTVSDVVLCVVIT